MVRRGLVGLVALLIVTAIPAGASEDTRSRRDRPALPVSHDVAVPTPLWGQVDADSLGLADGEPARQWHSLGTDTFQVWRCNDPRSAMQLASAMTRDLTDHFLWLSNGRYTPRFVAGGDGCIDDLFSDNHAVVERWLERFDRVDRGDGAIFVDRDGGFGGAPGLPCPDPLGYCDDPGWLPDLRVGSDSYDPGFIAAAIGQMHRWPWGEMIFDDDDPYDPMDMAHWASDDGLLSTMALNRYGAGWFGPDEVVVHVGGTQTFDLMPPGDGIQMAVIPTGLDFLVLTPRTRSAYDPIPVAWEGVTVHLVSGVSTTDVHEHPWPTFYTYEPFPALDYDAIDIHRTPENVITVGSERTFRNPLMSGVTVSVDDHSGSGYIVTLSGYAANGQVPHRCPTQSGFSDVCDSHLFTGDITWLSSTGITRGCNPPHNTRYCPSSPVTRAQMATFLVRALELPPANDNDFTDVSAGNAHVHDIAALAQAGITRGCNPPSNNQFCPDAPVTREQMASFLTRSLRLAPGQHAFIDVPGNNPHRSDIGALDASGITRGCNPPTNDRFCPGQSVTRAQMAAFLNRALG